MGILPSHTTTSAMVQMPGWKTTWKLARNYEKALEITERIYGPGAQEIMHVITAQLGSLVHPVRVTGRKHCTTTSAPWRLWKRTTVRTILEPGRSWRTLRLCTAELERYEDALIFNQRARTVAETTLGMQHPHTLHLRHQQAGYIWSLGDKDKAADLYKKNLAEFEQALEPDHTSLITKRAMVAIVLAEEGKFREADAMCRLALDQSRRIYGEEGKWTHKILSMLAEMHAMEGKYFTAIEEAVEAERLQLRTFLRIVGGLTETNALRRDRISEDRLFIGAPSLLTLNEQLASGKLERGKAGAVATATGNYWDQLIRSRAAVLDEIGARGRVLQSAKDQETRELFNSGGGTGPAGRASAPG